ncbi:MAG: transmembrane 220 family protein [Gammaproteobacteria bacterium]
MVIFAILQWNDADGLIWICIYLAAALLALLVYIGNCQPCTIAWASLTSLFACYMIIALVPGLVDFIEANAYTEIFFNMNDEKPYIEQTREILGLFIVLFYSAGILIHVYKKT